ncbi:uncharacterized protein EAE97_000800 [Botrytis byssoidea]|uniref:Uncharacterized protein n=1 Tax=Botrytis byssoidea TaxID=139641 RepID=A0A9P5IXK5_9HELO|nr:uncharacterized protein EAE97_000800 [Botrytis byssoidea]KAF7953401.1 hypothetical protein EAE97_000800 [Botrytis byssoidea]
MGTEIPNNASTSLPIATAEWNDDMEKIQITSGPKIWEEMSHLAWPTNSLIPLLLEARKFKEEGRIEEAREVIKRLENTQMIRKIEQEEESRSKGDGDAEGEGWLVVDAMAVMDEMCEMDRNLKQDDCTKRHKTEKGLGKCNVSFAGMDCWSRLWNWCFAQRN